MSMNMLQTETVSLYRIIQFFVQNRGNRKETLWLPAIWNVCGYSRILEEQDGEMKVLAFDFIAEQLQYLLDSSRDYRRADTVDLDRSVIYSSLVRYTTAWDYDHDGEIESGTLLRLVVLLPLLKQMGVNILYLLPVTRYSELNLKGDIGSPYAVQSLFNLDPNLHEPLLDEMADMTIDDEMAALSEACRLLDIRVVVDFIPRVTAKNSDFIYEHPEWVYWMNKEASDSFKLPHVPELGFFEECTPDKLETVYRSPETAGFLRQFSQPPNEVDPILWEKLRARAAATGEELLTLVEQEMGLTTSPAHSDWINDVQPIWTDITFLRLYRDIAPPVRPLLEPDQAPYVLFDTIKCNYYPGEEPNRELWDILIDALKHNLLRYRIDGFRIDIGHVLPIPLLEEMFDTIKAIRPDALLISEDLFNRNHSKAAAVGYNIMLGSGWNIMTDIQKDNLLAYVNELPELDIHVFACAETADTPRITSRGGTALARMIAVFNHFLPNAIPFLATGFELNEEQPMNCGLGDNTNGAEIPRAFFNKMKLSWTNPQPMIPLLAELHSCKEAWMPLLKPERFFTSSSPDDVVIYGYMQDEELLLGCFNLHAEQPVRVDLTSLRPPGGALTVRINSMISSPLEQGTKAVDELWLEPHQGLILTSGNLK